MTTGQMSPEQRQLWERISRYQLDDPESVFQFTERLAEENAWPVEYALRVAEEYRRFAFLAVAAGHPVSPPDPVDQAWHLHQLYSDSYWDEFCGKVLGKTFSHQPTKGGHDESSKFADWYLQTVRSYTLFFGEEPPADIWSPASPAVSQLDFARVDRRNNWVFPKTAILAFVQAAGFMALVVLVLMAAAYAVTGVPVWRMPGKDFFGFYCLSLFGLSVLAAVLVARVRFRAGEAKELHPYEAACLSGGKRAAADAVIASMVKAKTLCWDVVTGTYSAGEALPSDAHPMEDRLQQYTRIAKGFCTTDALRAAVQVQVAELANRLEKHQLLLGKANRWKIRQVVAGLFGGLLMTTVTWFFGEASGVPVLGPLVLLILLTGVGALTYCSKFSPHTSLGQSALKAARERCYAMETRLRNRRMEPDASDVALMVGVQGASALAILGLSDLRYTLAPPRESNGNGSSCGAGCGGTGCGGGGCSGGGCGGCGGG